MSYSIIPIQENNTNTNPITIISEHHSWRTLSGIQTCDYFAYRKALKNGCHLQRAFFALRHPEQMICDLSNLESIYNGMSHNNIVSIWKHLDSLTHSMKVFGVVRVRGDGLSPEIAIAGPSSSTLEDLKASIVREAFLHHKLNPQLSIDKKPSRGIAKNRLLIDASSETINFHNKFCAFYSEYISYEHWDNCSAFNTRFIYEDHAIWHQIKKIGKNKLFLLSAGLPLALGYMTATEDHNIFFSEVHRQNDSNLLNKDLAFKGIYPSPARPREPWVIIDKSYTGGSLRQAANLIRKIYGYDVEVITIALFPKSFSAFMGADYAVYAGKLFDVRVYAPFLDRDFWHLQLIEGANYESAI